MACVSLSLEEQNRVNLRRGVVWWFFLFTLKFILLWFFVEETLALGRKFCKNGLLAF